MNRTWESSVEADPHPQLYSAEDLLSLMEQSDYR